jgi:2-(3-amino-3-carboxypropyl)histidine synthase
MPKQRFNLETSRLKKEILKHHVEKVLLQLPEGLKPEAPKLAAAIEEAGAQAVISGDPCYGACDLALTEAETLGVNLIVHYGHSLMMTFPDSAVPVVYVEAKAELDLKPTVEKAIPLMKAWNNIGLATTIQHTHKLSEAARTLEAAGKTVHVGNTKHGKKPGQILGCNYDNAKNVADKVDGFLFIGGGRFHALGLFLATMKPTIAADPYLNNAVSIDADAKKIIHKRYASINEAKTAQNFGVIIGLKPGQKNLKSAQKIKKTLEAKGKKAVLIALREITPATLTQFPTIDCYVNTACPRIALDEASAYTKPVLTPKEAMVALGKTRWETLLEKGLL